MQIKHTFSLLFTKYSFFLFVQVYDIVNVAGQRWQEVYLVLDSNIYPLAVDTAAAPAAMTATTTPAPNTRVSSNSAGPPAAAVIEPVPPVAAAAAVIMSTVKQEPGTRNQARP